ncbi:MAG: sigma-70 family RNA polymerase sigma factor [Rhizobiales bacterium]|nr:sigma-70 family RNA polymerase sigma factor [Hyphomicrobiales bacterium]
MQQEWIYFSSKIKNFIHSRVQNAADAEDITQNTLLKVHQNIDNLNDKTKLESWIYAIARNSINSHYRKTNIDPLAQSSDALLNNISIEDKDQDAILELACCLKGFIGNLPKDAQTAINIISFDGLSQAQYAKKLNIPLPTAKSRIQRARKQLALELQKCCKYEGNQVTPKNINCPT